MNLLNEKMRILKHSIHHFEKMAMLSHRSSDKWEYRRKADRCRDELDLILKDILEV